MKNSIASSLYELTKIPHLTFTMNHNERIAHLSKIKECVSNVKTTIKKADKYELDNIDLSILDSPIPVFMLAYYGVSVKDLISDYVASYKVAFSEYINKINMKYCCKAPYNKPYKKILFCSGRLFNYSSVFKSTYEIINHLSQVSDFHVDVMGKPPLQEEIKNAYSRCKNIYEIKSIHHNIDIIAANRYDIIIYPDMNMDESTSCIGLFRLAPIQITTFGHSETSGMADYFVTSKQYEIEPEKNYTEKVACFDSLALKYKKTNILDQIKNFTNRSYFQIPQNCNLYYCNSSFFKMGKEMIDIFKGILDQDKDAIIAITKLGIAYWDLTFFDFFDKYLQPEYKNRIRFIQRLNFWENINLLYLSDVFLESYPFGNMNSTLECFMAGLPVISMPTTKINSRFTYAYYKKMGLENKYCVLNQKDYIIKAVEVATNKNKNSREEIMQKSSILFDEEESVVEWENFLRKL